MTHYDDSSALFVIDIQNDFADPKGSLYVSAGETIVDRVNAEIERAVTAGVLVAYKQDWHPESTRHFKKDGGIWPVHCVCLWPRGGRLDYQAPGFQRERLQALPAWRR